MLFKVKVEDLGDIDLLLGGYEDVLIFNECNKDVIDKGLRLVVVKRVLFGIIKVFFVIDLFLLVVFF